MSILLVCYASETDLEALTQRQQRSSWWGRMLSGGARPCRDYMNWDFMRKKQKRYCERRLVGLDRATGERAK